MTQAGTFVGIGGNPVVDEFEFQSGVVMEREARRMNNRFLNQQYRL